MSPDSSVRILFVGDMHLGRLPSRIPDTALDQGGWSRREIGPAGAWRRIVDAALELEVDAVALAGDLVASRLSQPGLCAEDLPLAIAEVLAR